MGIWLNETILAHPEKVTEAVHDLARSGYQVVRVFLRNTNFNHRSPQVVQAVARIVETAHKLGLRAALDCEPHPEPVARDAGNLFPDAIGYRVVRVETAIVNGRFAAHVPAPRTFSTRADFRGIEAAFLRQGASIKPLENLQYDHRVVEEPYQDGFSTADSSFTEGRPGLRWVYAHLSGRLEGVADGKMILYVRFSDARTIDFWSDGIRNYYDTLLECYRDIPLDGVGWDEPGVGGNWTSYLFGDSAAAAFERLNGYKLKDKWYLLDEPGTSPEAARVRLDYYRTLNEGLFDAQRQMIVKARELLGDDLLLGTHHTWQGEAGINDYRSWAVDYFRLNDNMDAGYSDGWWWDHKSICYAYTLGVSLGRLTPSGETEANTWDMKSTNARVEYYARLMTLMDIVWFNIWYGESADVQLFPSDYTWQTTVREVNRHREDQRKIGKSKPVVDIAMLHGWETVCGINRADIASAHKTFCLNTSELFVKRNVAFDWIDTRLLAESRVESGKLTNALGRYSILILPYAAILPRAAWEAVRAFARAGGKIVFVAAPPEFDTEGKSFRDEFAELTGAPVVSLERYLAHIDSVAALPPSRPDRLDITVPLAGDKDRLLTSVEGEPHGIRNAAGNVVYITDLDPRHRLLQIIEPWMNPEVACFSDSILWRLYRDADRSLLVCVAIRDRQLRGVIRWAGKEIELASGTTALLELRDQEIKVIGEGVRHRIK